MKKTTLAEEVGLRIEELNAAKAPLTGERNALAGEKEALLSAPLARDDLKQFVGDFIDTRASDYTARADWMGLMKGFIYPKRAGSTLHSNIPLSLRDVDEVMKAGGSRATAVFGDMEVPRIVQDKNGIFRNTDDGFYFFFGDLIKSKVAEYLDANFPQYTRDDEKRVGPPLPQRRERLAEIAVRVSDIDAQIADIDAELRSLRAATGTTTKPDAARAAVAIKVGTRGDWDPGKLKGSYYQGQVMQLAGWTNLWDLGNAIKDRGFPKPAVESGYFCAAEVDAWLRVNTP